MADLDAKVQAVFKKKGYRISEKLGAGAFGEVYKATNFKNGDTLCAVKVMDLTKMSAKIRDKFLPRELAALMEVKHPNTVRVYDIIKMSKKIFVFMEYASHGDLSAYVKKHKQVKEELARFWFGQTALAVDYLHTEIRMAHRDIKLDNILLDSNDMAKLTDFGFANITAADDCEDIYELVSHTYCGTVPYYSPQLVAKKPYNPFKADVWAMGVVLFSLLEGRFPFHFQDQKMLFKEQNDFPKYIRSRFKMQVSAGVRDLIEKQLQPDEQKRLNMGEVLEHEWLKASLNQ